MAKLDDPDLQSALVASAETSSSSTANARAVGMTRQAVHSYLVRHPELRERVDAAHRQTKVIAHHAPRMMPERATIEGALDPDARELPEHTRDAFLALVWEHANDAESKGCSKALHILAEYHIGADVHAARLRAQREAEDTADSKTDNRPVIIRHGTPPPRVVDAEVIERPPRLDS